MSDIHPNTTLTDWRERAEHYEVLCDKLEARIDELVELNDALMNKDVDGMLKVIKMKTDEIKAEGIEEMIEKLASNDGYNEEINLPCIREYLRNLRIQQ